MRLPPTIPAPADRRIAIRVSPAAERALRDGHPWLFEKAIQRQSHSGQPGDLAVIFDRKDRFLAVGLYDPHSHIRVRLLQHGQAATIDRWWWQTRIVEAARLRQPLQQSGHTTGYRLVHGENDGLPGLVVDCYGRTLVLKLYTTALVPHLRDILAALAAVAPPERMVVRLSRAVAAQPAHLHGLEDGQVVAGPGVTVPVHFLENGLYFAADVIQGQKTGFFLDQRENRARVEGFTRGKRVLNVFAYTGGFSLYAARGGATQVVSLDLSQPALVAAAYNFSLNQGDRAVAAAEHEQVAGDAFAVLEQFRAQGRHFEMVLIDPPAFAKKQAEVPRALAAYGRLVRLGLAVLRPSGILMMASCSSRVEAETFFNTVHQAAAAVRRPLEEIERTGHPLDHPVTFKEGAYLKGLFALAP